MNKVILTGNLGQKPELKATANGTQVAEANLAVSDGYGDKKRTFWFGLQAWQKTAESMAQYLDKGSRVLIEGRLTQDQWEKDGKPQTKTRIVVERWEFAGSAKEGHQNAQEARGSRQPSTGERELPPPAWRGENEESDDIPF